MPGFIILATFLILVALLCSLALWATGAALPIEWWRFVIVGSLAGLCLSIAIGVFDVE